ncbi:MAG: winged helix-turn-helix domain-containing protein [Oscillospiraceae bacterium]|nr:winged helix-turn-helix domain-containing protein [Oscillospiraceae bacterium]
MNIYIGGLRVYMLGGFEIYYGGALVQLKKKSTSKPVQLLQLLLYHREAGISRHSLMESLYGSEGEIDAANSLNATVPQLRKLLKDTHLPDENYIRTRFDRYYFESSYPIWVDTEEASILRQKADLMHGPDRIGLLYQLCDLFHGRFLPELDGEDWAEIVRAQYQRIYRDSLNEVCNALKEKHAYNEIYRLTAFAAKLFPFDEWQVWQQECLLAQGRIREARELYKQVEKLYMTELDAPPPERMRARFRKPEEDPWRKTESLSAVQQWLENAKKEGPSSIPFAAFIDVYNLINGISAASQTPFHLLLCTLANVDGRSVPDVKEFHDSMELLEASIANTLRAEDVFTRYSRSQFLAILVGAKKENLDSIYGRINGAFSLTDKSEKLKLVCQMISAEEMKLFDKK